MGDVLLLEDLDLLVEVGRDLVCERGNADHATLTSRFWTADSRMARMISTDRRPSLPSTSGDRFSRTAWMTSAICAACAWRYSRGSYDPVSSGSSAAGPATRRSPSRRTAEPPSPRISSWRADPGLAPVVALIVPSAPLLKRRVATAVSSHSITCATVATYP